MTAFFDGLFRWQRRIEAFILAASILFIAGLTMANVVSRSLLGSSLASTEEVSRFLIIVVTFVGLSYGAGQGRHIRMTAFYDMLGLRARKGLRLFITLTTSALLFLLASYAIDYVLVVRRLGSVSPVLQVPLYWFYAPAPIGLFLAGIQYALAAVRNFRSPGVYLAYDVEDVYLSEEHEAERAL
ncbi:MAG: TRAP transporter small permease subunit [Candidatus Hydrogenedens sp.]|nr:TRAP transporter small permease subunit [Candidatus Hydrogenedens sp.]